MGRPVLLPAGASFSASGEVGALPGGCSPPPHLLSCPGLWGLGQDPQSRSHWHATRAQQSQSHEAGLRLEVAPEDPPRATPLQPSPDTPSLGPRNPPLHAPPARCSEIHQPAFCKERKRCGLNIYTFISLVIKRRDPSGRARGRLGPPRGVGARGPLAPFRTLAWPRGGRAPPGGRRKRVSLLRGIPRPELPGPTRSAEAE